MRVVNGAPRHYVSIVFFVGKQLLCISKITKRTDKIEAGDYCCSSEGGREIQGRRTSKAFSKGQTVEQWRGGGG